MLIDIISAMEITQHLDKLMSLDPLLRDSVWVTQGCLKKGLLIIAGMVTLQILFPD